MMPISFASLLPVPSIEKSVRSMVMPVQNTSKHWSKARPSKPTWPDSLVNRRKIGKPCAREQGPEQRPAELGAFVEGWPVQDIILLTSARVLSMNSA